MQREGPLGWAAATHSLVQMAEGSPRKANDAMSALGTKIHGIDRSFTPPISNDAPSDYSDAPSVDLSHPSSQKRRNKRGGRKNRGRAEPLKSVSEIGVSKKKDQLPHSPPQPESRDGDSSQASDSNSTRHKSGTEKAWNPKSSRPSGDGKPKGDTGIRAFNLKRAESSGGGPPIAVVIERPKQKRKPKSDTKERNSHEPSDKEEEETERTKCLQIRFDLNLEVEKIGRASCRERVF